MLAAITRGFAQVERGMNDRSDIVVIITGGAGGLGRAMTLGLAKAGVRVAAAELATRRDAGEELLRLARDAGLQDRIAVIDCDVTRDADCRAAVQRTVERFGAVHGLVNNAAIGMQTFGPVEVLPRKRFYEANSDAWCTAIQTNVCGPFLMSKAIAPTLVQQGWGRIVNITTSHTTMVRDGFTPYGPSKAAVEAATQAWAGELAGTGVTVNVLLPGGRANTRMIPANEVADRSILIQPEVMVAPVTWLMSRASDGVTSRRIVAKNWDAKIAQDTPAKVGAPAGWTESQGTM
jgi:3-oxoacyl-[acyl-carrier protein] reductase